MRQTSATQRKETASKSSELALTGERQAVAKRLPVGEPGKGAAQVIFTVLPTMSPRNHAGGIVHFALLPPNVAGMGGDGKGLPGWSVGRSGGVGTEKVEAAASSACRPCSVTHRRGDLELLPMLQASLFPAVTRCHGTRCSLRLYQVQLSNSAT